MVPTLPRAANGSIREALSAFAPVLRLDEGPLHLSDDAPHPDVARYLGHAVIEARAADGTSLLLHPSAQVGSTSGYGSVQEARYAARQLVGGGPRGVPGVDRILLLRVDAVEGAERIALASTRDGFPLPAPRTTPPSLHPSLYETEVGDAVPAVGMVERNDTGRGRELASPVPAPPHDAESLATRDEVATILAGGRAQPRPSVPDGQAAGYDPGITLVERALRAAERTVEESGVAARWTVQGRDALRAAVAESGRSAVEVREMVARVEPLFGELGSARPQLARDGAVTFSNRAEVAMSMSLEQRHRVLAAAVAAPGAPDEVLGRYVELAHAVGEIVGSRVETGWFGHSWRMDHMLTGRFLETFEDAAVGQRGAADIRTLDSLLGDSLLDLAQWERSVRRRTVASGMHVEAVAGAIQRGERFAGEQHIEPRRAIGEELERALFQRLEPQEQARRVEVAQQQAASARPRSEFARMNDFVRRYHSESASEQDRLRQQIRALDVGMDVIEDTARRRAAEAGRDELTTSDVFWSINDLQRATGRRPRSYLFR